VTTASGIYAIVNTVNGRRYVGRASNIRTRCNSHRYYLRAGKHDNQHLQRAWNKYGEESFRFVVLEYILPEFLLDIEQKYLDKNKKGYNIVRCAEASMRGFKHRAESRKKMSEALMGRVVSPETRAKISAANKGKKRTPEQCARISASHKGIVQSAEQREKLHLRMLGNKQTLGYKPTAETRARISVALRGKKKPASFSIKLAERNRARARSKKCLPTPLLS